MQLSDRCLLAFCIGTCCKCSPNTKIAFIFVFLFASNFLILRYQINIKRKKRHQHVNCATNAICDFSLTLIKKSSTVSYLKSNCRTFMKDGNKETFLQRQLATSPLASTIKLFALSALTISNALLSNNQEISSIFLKKINSRVMEPEASMLSTEL